MLKPIKRNIYKVEYIEDRHGAVVRYVVADTAVMAIRKAKRKWGSKMRYPTVRYGPGYYSRKGTCLPPA